MDYTFEVSSFGLVLLILLGILLFALMRFLRRASRLIQMSKSRRAAFERALPVVEALLGLVYLLSAVPMVFKDHPQYSPIGLALVLLGFAYVSWFAIRDFITGAFLKSGQLFQTGEYIQLEQISGKVTRLGYRTLSIETENGDEAIIPYSRVSHESIVRTPLIDGVCRHSFTITTELTSPTAAVSELIRRAALNHHWSSVTHEPQVRYVGERTFDVVVFALAAARGHDIQMAVRDAVGTPAG